MYYCASYDNIKVSDRPNYEFILGNINDYNLITYLLKSKKIDTIVHFAAQSHVDNSFLESFKYTEDNVKGTHTLLECCRLYQKKTQRLLKIIHVSTDEVYGESINDDVKNEESSILVPTNPYAATKAGAEMLAISYIKSYNLPIIITRGNNVYGPNQYPEKLIPKFIKLLRENKKLTIHGDGSNLRSFIHTDDVSRAFNIILDRGNVGEIYNIGSNEYHSIEDLAKIINSIR
jgi:UDP-glucose 4,6-dehydratase